MLIQLKIENFALIEIIEINFEKGLNIFTGDSGSGKSLILDSLNVLFGGTNIPLKHLIRPGKVDCLIEAKFNSSLKVNKWLLRKGFRKISSEIVIKRKSYKKNNRILTKYTINELPISKKLLEDLGLFLIDFAGQADSFLFDSQEHKRLIIDDLGTKELLEINFKVKKSWAKLEMLKKRKEEKIQLYKNKEENNSAIKKMLSILEEANLNESDEIINLQLKETRLANNFEINNSIKTVLNNFNNFRNEDLTVSLLITKSIKYLNKILNFDSKIEAFKEKLINIQNDVENLISDLSEYLEQVENDDVSLEDIQNRLFYLKNLERTFLLELPQLILKRDQLKKHVETNSLEEEIKMIDIKINTIQDDLNCLFQLQSSHRKEIANNLKHSVICILKNLGLENANFLIEFKNVNPTSDGSDNINFLFSANPDQELAPLSKIISGGEMSRFLLALKSSISKKPNTFFLDEIDNGLSGKSLFSLVEQIKLISNNRQVLCITHQPYLAAAGNVHFKVTKNVINGLTFTSISKLDTKNERKNELIDLIGGGFSEANDYASTLIDRAAA